MRIILGILAILADLYLGILGMLWIFTVVIESPERYQLFLLPAMLIGEMITFALTVFGIILITEVKWFWEGKD